MRLVIIGAGPTGLGAAIRWQELTGDPCLVLESGDRVGGLATSYTDENGFTWDLGSHLQFSHYEYFDRVLQNSIPEESWNKRTRSTWIWFDGQFIPYPFQLNLHRLRPAKRWECVEGLLDRPLPDDSSFAAWSESVFGREITRIFMRPYNEKLWACPMEQMSAEWISERVAVPELRQVLQSICQDEDHTTWGPNSTFRYPKEGGTGFVWKSVAKRLSADTIRLNTPVVSINSDTKTLTTRGGEQFSYDTLLSTIPMTALSKIVGSPFENILSGLRSTQTHIVGIGLKGRPPESLQGQCWSYFPQHDVPFYRMTVLSNLSERCVPGPEPHWSLMLEVSERNGVIQKDDLAREVIQCLQELKLVNDSDICSIWDRRLKHGYPVPTVDRDRILAPVHHWLEQRDIYSRGRFGAWKYEVSNQDHSFMQGVELIDRLRFGTAEPTHSSPNFVNSRFNAAPVSQPAQPVAQYEGGS